MFEKFGIMDLWSVIKKNMLLLLFSFFGLMILFGGINLFRVKDSVKTACENSGTKMNVSVASFYVHPITNESAVDKSIADYYRALPDDYVAVINADYCLDYLYDQILSKYSKESVIKYSDLSREEAVVKPQDLKAQHIKCLYQCKRQSGSTMIINLAAKSYNEELSRDVLEYLKEFLLIYVDSKIKSANIEYIGKSNKIVNIENLSQSDKNLLMDSSNQNVSSQQKSLFKFILTLVVKNIFVPAVVLWLLLVFCLIMRAFFNPTLNRKSDFTPYKIPVIGEINIDIDLGEKK